MTKQIVVITNGFVLIGDVLQSNKELHVTNASIIQEWGTTKGLGQIALEGPTPKTILAPCGEVMVERSQVIMRITCKV